MAQHTLGGVPLIRIRDMMNAGRIREQNTQLKDDNRALVHAGTWLCKSMDTVRECLGSRIHESDSVAMLQCAQAGRQVINERTVAPVTSETAQQVRRQNVRAARSSLPEGR